ncbi:unnamed protein product [Rotaria sp. Silwood1]|nr:unnamed protein product [Rotaria sp. Silwood1]CAF3777189.1 unnamed protein product [Rotaria sp. Silwood1]CAF4559032.1 unnamed protein product [Rotaria sp. Silwood1]CAF4613085.1 unnamed protein product [Rotaria sp. Silwood1]
MRGHFAGDQPLPPDEIIFNRSLCITCSVFQQALPMGLHQMFQQAQSALHQVFQLLSILLHQMFQQALPMGFHQMFQQALPMGFHQMFQQHSAVL